MQTSAVFHVFDGEGKAAPYREHVLCNESMIEEWSIDTPEIRAEVEKRRRVTKDEGDPRPVGRFEGDRVGGALEEAHLERWPRRQSRAHTGRAVLIGAAPCSCAGEDLIGRGQLDQRRVQAHHVQRLPVIAVGGAGDSTMFWRRARRGILRDFSF